MAGVKKEALRSGKFQGWYMDWQGRQRWFVGTTNQKETLLIAERKEDRHRRVKVGDLPPPKESDTPREFAEVAAQYVAWGRSCGGIKGRPWAPAHAEKREAGLNWWQGQLGLKTLHDLEGTLPRVEKALQELQKQGRSNLTIQHRATCLTAFCCWCEQRGLLASNPLKGLVAFPKEARQTRRALTVDEIQRLLNCCEPARRLTYEVALASGLRANELRSLRAEDIDAKRGGLILRADWTKNRKPGFQPLPLALMARLAEHLKDKAPGAPMLTIGTQPARDLKRDLDKAGLAKYGPGGKVDFHALRVAYTTFVIECGANIKEAQALARHATPDLTLNVYARARNERLAEVAEAVGNAALFVENQANSKQRLAAGAESVDVTIANETACAIEGNRGTGVPCTPASKNGDFEKPQTSDKLSARNPQTTYENDGGAHLGQSATGKHSANFPKPSDSLFYEKSKHYLSTPGEPLPPDLLAVVNAWSTLPPHVRAAICTLAEVKA